MCAPGAYFDIPKFFHEDVRFVVQLMSKVGLRMKEVANLQLKHFKQKQDGWHLEIEAGAGCIDTNEETVLYYSNNELEKLAEGMNLLMEQVFGGEMVN